ncbi:unnamed protein product [Caenorhabditis angaria]|uniref:mRNA cap guanine-N(7) methyltransferase n=1 Tax=Caenorhabditis angaria TaxID=860376 RepID=B6VBY1_9PELO|nr:hypothetical protein Csp3_JD05.009 [Caenorhabditis angaria]CAI5438517.1 unnamed protein product [Caenorhabditis angaria]
MSSEEVAQHYNNVKQTGIDDRKESRIFHMRNMNNWIKSQLINEAVQILNSSGIYRPRVLDIACGKGGDLRKWDIAKVKNVVMADVADVSIDQAKDRYEKMKDYRHNLFDAQFIVSDCTKSDLSELIEDKTPFDLTSCQFALHYSFVDEQSARQFLKNAVGSLKPGGVFVGTLPDADRIVWAVRNSENGEFANEVCKIRYENVDELAEGKTPLFGAKFHFSLDSQVNCPEFLAYFPLLQHLLEEFDMELLFVRNFADYVERWKIAGKNLLEKMKGLETYPSDRLSTNGENEYTEAKQFLEKLDESQQKTFGTISKSEWEAICMYLVFAFRKKGSPPESEESDSKKPKN